MNSAFAKDSSDNTFLDASNHFAVPSEVMRGHD